MLTAILLFGAAYLLLIGVALRSFHKLRKGDTIEGVDDYQGP